MMYNILSTISLLLLQLITASASGESCGLCLPTGPPYEDTFLITRLWSIQSSSWSDLDVIEEFNEGFAPIVTNMPGFIQYTAAVNNYNSSTVYFSNVFESQELAHNAQLAAQEFVANGALKDVIVPYYFTESTVAFDIAADECVNTSHSGMYLNTRLYKVISVNNELTADALRNDTAPLASAFAKQPGFVNYVGTITEDKEYLFFSNVFDDLSSAQTANNMGVSSANNTDEGDSALLAATEGKIIFDYICTEGDASVNSTLVPSSSASTSGANTGRTLPVYLMSVLVAISTLIH